MNRIRLRGAALALASFVAMMLGLAWIGGFFWGVGRADPIAAASFGVLGLNLGSLVIPHESALFPSHLVLRNWWEGDFYLGAGIIAAWVMILLFMPQAVIKPIIRHWPLAVALSAFTLFCLSNQIKFGEQLWYPTSFPLSWTHSSECCGPADGYSGPSATS